MERISSEIAGESKLYEFSDEILVISLSGIDDVDKRDTLYTKMSISSSLVLLNTHQWLDEFRVK